MCTIHDELSGGSVETIIAEINNKTHELELGDVIVKVHEIASIMDISSERVYKYFRPSFEHESAFTFLHITTRLRIVQTMACQRRALKKWRLFFRPAKLWWLFFGIVKE